MPWKPSNSSTLPNWSEEDLEQIRQQQPGPGKTDLGAETPGTFDVFQESARRGLKEGLSTAERGLTAPYTLVEKEKQPQDYTTQLLGQNLRQGYDNPDWWVAQLTHGLTSSSPTLGAGVVGAGAGATVGGLPGALVGGATGMGSGAFVQTIAPAYQRARERGLDHDAAVDAAIEQSQIAGLFSYVAGLAPGAALYGRTAGGALKKPLSEALAQIFGVQPTLAGAEHVARHYNETGELPRTEDIETTMARSVGTGAGLVGAHAGARAAMQARRPSGPDITVEPPVTRPEEPLSFIDLIPGEDGAYAPPKPPTPLLEAPRTGGPEGRPPTVSPGAEPPPPPPAQPGGGLGTFTARQEFAQRVREAGEPRPQYVTRAQPRMDFAAEPGARRPLAQNEYYHGGTYRPGTQIGDVLYLSKDPEFARSYVDMAEDRGMAGAQLQRLELPLENAAPEHLVQRYAEMVGIDTDGVTPASWFDKNLHGEQEVNSLVNVLRRQGYDHANLIDIPYGARGDAQNVIVAFPEAAAAQAGQKDLAIETAPLQGFYSPAQKAVQAAKHQKAPASQWKNQLGKGAAGREAKELGLDLWLDEKGKGEAVTAKEINDWLKAHEVEVLETTQTGEDLGQSQGRIQPLSEGYREVLLRPKGLEYTSPHFNTNEVVAITLGDRKGPRGENYAGLEHIQSDLHQRARKKGYFDPQAEEKFNSLIDKLPEVQNLPPDDPRLTSVLQGIRETRSQMERSRTGVPDAPFKDELWWQLGVKWAIGDAVRAGKDGIVLPKAHQMAQAAATEEEKLAPFYDKKLPGWAKKYARSLGGEVIEEIIPDYVSGNVPYGTRPNYFPIGDNSIVDVMQALKDYARIFKGSVHDEKAKIVGQIGEYIENIIDPTETRSAKIEENYKLALRTLQDFIYEGVGSSPSNIKPSAIKDILVDGFRDKEGNLHEPFLKAPTNTVIKFTPKMREALSGGQPLFAADVVPIRPDVEIPPGQERPTSAQSRLTGKEPSSSPKPGLLEPLRGRRAKRTEVAANLSGPQLRQQIEQLLNSGRAVGVSPAIGQHYFTKHKELGALIPADISVNVLDRVEPVGKGRVRAIFKDEGGQEIPMYAPTEELLRARAFHFSDGFGNSGLFFTRFNTAGSSDERVLGELWHENTHALRRNGYFPDAIWGRLINHAGQLQILEQDYRDFARRIKSPNWMQYASGVSIEEIYEELYGQTYGGDRAEIDEAINQEAVAHMLELVQHGELGAQDLAPIQDILETMASGGFKKGEGRAPGSKESAAEGKPNPYLGEVELESVPLGTKEELIDYNDVFSKLAPGFWDNLTNVDRILHKDQPMGHVLSYSNSVPIFLGINGTTMPLTKGYSDFTDALLNELGALNALEEDWEPESEFTPPVVKHPKKNSKGQDVTIQKPHKATSADTWTDPTKVAVFTPGGRPPAQLSNIAVYPVNKEPNYLAATYEDVDADKPFEPVPGKKVGSGILIVEPDGRIWLTSPTNQFGNYENTLPKGTVESGSTLPLDLQLNAIKETWEETGLYVEITGFIGDFERSTSKARYYVGQRISGSPTEMGWESQAMNLVPIKTALGMLNNEVDRQIIQIAEEQAWISSEPAQSNYESAKQGVKQLLAKEKKFSYKKELKKIANEFKLTPKQVQDAVDILEQGEEETGASLDHATFISLATTLEKAADLSEGDLPHLQTFADALFAKAKRQEIAEQFENQPGIGVDEAMNWEFKQTSAEYKKPWLYSAKNYVVGTVYDAKKVLETYPEFAPINAYIKYLPLKIQPIFKSNETRVKGFYVKADTGAELVYDLNAVGTLANHGTMLDLVGKEPSAKDKPYSIKKPLSPKYTSIENAVKDFIDTLPSLEKTLTALAQPTHLATVSDQWGAGNELAAYADAIYTFLDNNENNPDIDLAEWAALNKLTWDLHQKTKPEYTGIVSAAEALLSNPKTEFEKKLKAVTEQATKKDFLEKYAPNDILVFSNMEGVGPSDSAYLLSSALDGWAKEQELSEEDHRTLVNFLRSFVPFVISYDRPDPSKITENVPPSDYELHPEKYYPPRYETVEAAKATLGAPARELFDTLNQSKWVKQLGNSNIKDPKEALAATLMLYIAQNSESMTPVVYAQLDKAAHGLLPRLKEAVNLQKQQEQAQQLTESADTLKIENTLGLPQKVTVKEAKDYLSPESLAVYEPLVDDMASTLYQEAQPKTEQELSDLFESDSWDLTIAHAIDDTLISDYSGELTGPPKQIKDELRQVMSALMGDQNLQKTTFETFQKDLVRSYGNRHYTFSGQGAGGSKPKEIWTDEQGEKYLFKPVQKDKAYLALAETLGGQISQLVNPKNPTIFPIQLQNRFGSMQRFLPTQGTLVENKLKVEDLTVDQLRTLMREHVVDWLISNHDGHRNQFLLDNEGGLVGIDKGQAYKYFGKDKLSTDYHPNAKYGEREPVYNELWRAFKQGKLDAQISEMAGGLVKEIEEEQAFHDQKIAKREELYERIAANGEALEKRKSQFLGELKKAFEDLEEDRDGLVVNTQMSMQMRFQDFHNAVQSEQPGEGAFYKAGQELEEEIDPLLEDLIKGYVEAVPELTEENRSELHSKMMKYKGVLASYVRSIKFNLINNRDYFFSEALNSPDWDMLSSVYLTSNIEDIATEAILNQERAQGKFLTYAEIGKIHDEITNLGVEIQESVSRLSNLKRQKSTVIFDPVREAINDLNHRLPDNEFIDALRPYAESRFKGKPLKIEAFLDFALQRKRNLAEKFYKFYMGLTDYRQHALGGIWLTDSKLQEDISKHKVGEAQGLTEAEYSAISNYTGSGYKSINNRLKKETALVAGELNLDWVKYAANAEVLRSALNKLPVYTGTVYRGQAGSNTPELFKMGAVFWSHGFLSTTKSQEIAKDWAAAYHFIIESKSGRDVSDHSQHKSEKEIIFPPDTAFLITKILAEPRLPGSAEKKLVIYMTELPEMDFSLLD